VAIVTGPLHSSEARGAVGALEYNSHRGRAFVKKRTTPVTQYSDPQKATRLLMVPIIAAWQSLSDTQRANWEHFAHENHLCDWTGQLKRISGWNWFAKANSPLVYVSASLLTAPPFPLSDYTLDVIGLGASVPYGGLEWIPATPPPVPAWYLIIWLAGPNLATVHPSIKQAKRVNYSIEQQAQVEIAFPAPGWYDVWVQPVSSQGISMTLTHLRGEAT
jgi:hypothetical protein